MAKKDSSRDKMRAALNQFQSQPPVSRPADMFTQNSDIVSRQWDYVEGGRSGYTKRQAEDMDRLARLWMTKQPYPGAAARYREAWIELMRKHKAAQEDDIEDVFDWKAWRDDYFRING